MPIAPHKKIIAAISGFSIILTMSFSGTARAGNDDVAKALAALVGVAIVGAIIADSSKDHKKTVVVTKPAVKPKPLPPRVSRKILPRRCLRSFKIDTGEITAFGRRCLNKHYAFAADLPRHCYTEFWTKDGRRGVYTSRCMHHKGFRLARH